MEERKEVDVELLETNTTGEQNAQLPMNFIASGIVGHDDVRVYIRQSTLEDIEKLSKSDTKREVGSILLGNVLEDMGKIHVVISDYIEAKYTDASAASLTFTHETWDYVYTEQNKHHADKKIVGWQHTHPGYGVFLSSYDTFIQENFFNLPFQLAYVVDPVQGQRGFFQWKNDKIQKLDGFYIYDDIGRTIKGDLEKPKTKSKDEGKSYKWMALASLCLTAAVTVIFTFSLISNNQKVTQTISELTKQNDHLQDIIDQQESDIAALKIVPNVQYGGVVFEKYTVQKGDTLSSICIAKGLNYASYRKILMSINGIKNPNLILTGQILLLPISGSVKED